VPTQDGSYAHEERKGRQQGDQPDRYRYRKDDGGEGASAYTSGNKDWQQSGQRPAVNSAQVRVSTHREEPLRSVEKDVRPLLRWAEALPQGGSAYSGQLLLLSPRKAGSAR
jgi:hypothetical protein